MQSPLRIHENSDSPPLSSMCKPFQPNRFFPHGKKYEYLQKQHAQAQPPTGILRQKVMQIRRGTFSLFDLSEFLNQKSPFGLKGLFYYQGYSVWKLIQCSLSGTFSHHAHNSIYRICLVKDFRCYLQKCKPAILCPTPRRGPSRRQSFRRTPPPMGYCSLTSTRDLEFFHRHPG